MSTLTDNQVLLLAEAGTLMAAHAKLLDSVEIETLADVASRFIRFHRHAIVTPREWAVFYQAVEAMRAAQQRQDVAQARELARARVA
jgi:hypothetical protein